MLDELLNKSYYYLLGCFDNNYDKNKFMIMWNDHRPFILSPEVRENYSIIQNAIRKFAELLEKALDSIDQNKQKLLSIVEKNEAKPGMMLKEKRFIFREVEKHFIKYQQLYITLKKEKTDANNTNSICSANLQRSTRKDSNPLNLWFKIAGIIDEDQFKASWVKTYAFDSFPWKNIKFKLWNQKECYDEYTSAITSQNDFIENVLSVDKIKEIYKTFSHSERGKVLSKLRGKVAIMNAKPKIKSIETKNIDSMDTEETIHSDKFNSQPTSQNIKRTKRSRKPATVKKRSNRLISENIENSVKDEDLEESHAKESNKTPYDFDKPNFKEIYNLKDNQIVSKNTKKRERKRLGKIANKNANIAIEVGEFKENEEETKILKSNYDPELRMEVIQEIPSFVKSEDSEVFPELSQKALSEFWYCKGKRYGILKVTWSEGIEKWENKGVFHKNWVKKFKSI